MNHTIIMELKGCISQIQDLPEVDKVLRLNVIMALESIVKQVERWQGMR